MGTADTIVLDGRYAETRAQALALIAELEQGVAAKDLRLPSLPDVALTIRNAIADDAMPVNELVRLVGTDPALAARLLHTANSALFFRGTRPISNLHTAVLRLGLRMVRNVALSLAAQQVFIGYATRDLREPVTAVWKHCVHVAALAHMLARLKTDVNPDDAFLAGLLHEVGKLCILMRASGHPELLGTQALLDVLDEWHGRVGRVVVETWQLPPELGDVIAGHETCSLQAAEPASLTHVVAVANFLAVGSAEWRERLPEECPSFGSLTLEPDTFRWLLRAGDVDIQLLMLAFGT